MTNNELAVTDIQFAVNYKPSTITIENEDQLDALIQEVKEHYSLQVFSDSNIPEAKEARAQLNKYVKAMEDRRKEIKRDFTKPLTDFEEVMKSYVVQLSDISDSIGDGIKKYDEEQKAIRLVKIQEEMKKLSELFNVEADVIEVHSNWLAKGSFTTKGEVRPKVIDEIKDKMKIVAMERDRIAADKETVTDYAEIAGLDPYAWANMIDQGWNVSDVREKIKQAVEDKRLREQAEAERLQREEEYKKAMDELARSQAAETESGAAYDTETGELIGQHSNQRETLDNASNHIEDMITATLRLTGTVEQMQALNAFIVDQGIQVVPVEE